MPRSARPLAVVLLTALLVACGASPGAPGAKELVEQVARGLSGPEAALPEGLVATEDELAAALVHATLAEEAAERVQLAIADGVTETRAALKAAGVSLDAAEIGRFEMRRTNQDPAEIKTYTVHAELVLGEARHDLTLPAVEGARGWALGGPPTLRLEAPAATAARTLLRHGQAALDIVNDHANAPDEAAKKLTTYLELHGAAIDAARDALSEFLGEHPDAALAQLGGAMARLADFAAVRARLKDTPAMQDPRVTGLLDRFRAGPGPR